MAGSDDGGDGDLGFGDLFGSGNVVAFGDMAMHPPPMTPPMQQVVP